MAVASNSNGRRNSLGGHRTWTMEEILAEQSGSILRVQLNRPSKRNAMMSSMYVFLENF